jgi:hypothetical protein
VPGAPTILFASFRLPNDPLRRAWAQFRAQIERPSPASPPADVQVGIWRLLASNNRELGRSAAAYATFAEARAHVLAIQASGPELHAAIVAAPEHGYGWCLETRDVVVMTCVRWHATAALAFAAARTAQVALLAAEVSPMPHRMTRSGRRTPRAPGGLLAEGSW